MRSTFICLHCGGTFLCNPRVKNQKSSDKECRRASRRAWKKKNYATNKSYRQKCLDSQKAWRARYPACDYQKQYRNAPVQYGNGVKAYAVLLNVHFKLPFKKIQLLFGDLFGYSINELTVYSASQQCYKKLEKTEEIIKSKVAENNVVHADET